MIWIGAAPCTDWLVHQVALKRIRTAVSQDTGCLLGQVFSRVDHFNFESNLVAYMLTVLDLFDLPGTERHLHLQITSTVYDMSDRAASDTRHKMA
jgi:hypothetical protein